MFVHAAYTRESNEPFLLEKGQMVKRFELTDLYLFTDSDILAYFDGETGTAPSRSSPMSFDHFRSRAP